MNNWIADVVPMLLIGMGIYSLFTFEKQAARHVKYNEWINRIIGRDPNKWAVSERSARIQAIAGGILLIMTGIAFLLKG